ncbi:MAG: hypothetical protein ONB06_02335, partial [candidate division KSB1 bacterium]|nr:hypothetical protein [candidate division KSB1 bacterium]
MGNAFDVVVERKQMATRKLGEKSREDTWQVSIRNHKKEGVTVTVVEHVWGEWEVRKSTHPPRRKDARTVEFDVATGAEGEAVLEYTILLRW